MGSVPSHSPRGWTLPILRAASPLVNCLTRLQSRQLSRHVLTGEMNTHATIVFIPIPTNELPTRLRVNNFFPASIPPTPLLFFQCEPAGHHEYSWIIIKIIGISVSSKTWLSAVRGTRVKILAFFNGVSKFLSTLQTPYNVSEISRKSVQKSRKS